MSDLLAQANFIYIERFVQDCKTTVGSLGVSGTTNTLDAGSCTLWNFRLSSSFMLPHVSKLTLTASNH